MPGTPALAVFYAEAPPLARLADFHKLEAGGCR